MAQPLELKHPMLSTLLERIAAKENPILVDVDTKEFSLPDECFQNVGKQISLSGGEVLHGWSLWKTSLVIEAEFHAIWKSPDGNLVDVSKAPPGVSQITFVPTADFFWNGKRVDNIRLNATGNRLVDDFIRVFEIRYESYSSPELVSYFGLVVFPKAFLEVRQGIEHMVLQGLSRSSPCFCQSGQIYKRCHGRNLEKKLRKLKPKRGNP